MGNDRVNEINEDQVRKIGEAMKETFPGCPYVFVVYEREAKAISTFSNTVDDGAAMRLLTEGVVGISTTKDVTIALKED